ncbi:hypothetical protein L1987_14299 [Smallanthus sonchifolius]|uniref:Uncharacterized protein n=1 Tax=Smallanthus sonchifolius TaxID=185202 RepID=A0ACB9J3F0_9ASTR|nr:hypothetical protein L1987_14299 [Smallanthus sonchifolius]
MPDASMKIVRESPTSAVVRFTAGSIEPAHHHTHEHDVVVMKGRKIVWNVSKNERFELNVGDFLFTPARDVHRVKYLEDTEFFIRSSRTARIRATEESVTFFVSDIDIPSTMAGGGNKQKPSKSKTRKPSKPSLFVEGGLLSDWSPIADSPPSKGKSNNSSASKNKSEMRVAIGSGSGGKSKASASNSRVFERQKPKMNAVGYSYPLVTVGPLG